MRADIAVPRHPDVELVRSLLDAGHEIARDEAWSRWRLNDRRLRAAVSALRHSGYAVVTESSQGACYRKARTYAEVREFVDGELLNRARHLETQARAMLDRAASEFGAAEQLSLIG